MNLPSLPRKVEITGQDGGGVSCGQSEDFEHHLGSQTSSTVSSIPSQKEEEAYQGAIHPDSMENFRRGAVSDSFLGVVDQSNGAIHLALVAPRGQQTIPADRYSTINGKVLEPLPARGGHVMLAQSAGINCVQIEPGLASGNAYGFSIVKTAQPQKMDIPTSIHSPAEKCNPTPPFALGTFRCAFNPQLPETRPAFTVGACRPQRTLPQEHILDRLLPKLTNDLMETHKRRSSF